MTQFNFAAFPGSRRARRQRKGGIVVLMAVLLPVIFIMAAFVINIAFLQLSRTELMIATDAAARAGGRAMSHYQDIDAAKTAARATAAMNNVAGAPLMVSFNDDEDIEFGDSDIDDDSNRFVFNKLQTAQVRADNQQATSVRVNGKLTSSSLNGQLQSLFPGMGLRDTFNLEQQAVATQLDRDIAMILDRSGSMGWITFDWPDGVSPWRTSVYQAAVDAGVMYTRTYYRNGRWRTSYRYTSGNDDTTFQQWLGNTISTWALLPKSRGTSWSKLSIRFCKSWKPRTRTNKFHWQPTPVMQRLISTWSTITTSFGTLWKTSIQGDRPRSATACKPDCHLC